MIDTRRLKLFLGGIGAFLILILCIVFSGRGHIKFTVNEPGLTVEYGQVYDAGTVKAVYKYPLFSFIKKKVNCKVDGLVGDELGEYTVVYTAKKGKREESKAVTVSVVDTVSPVIELVKNAGSYTSPNAVYEEEGFTAYDNHDGDITERVDFEEKDGVIYYTVADISGNVTKVERVINYKDVVLPELVLEGEKEMSIATGTSFKEPGYSATDDVDGDITDRVTVIGAVDGSLPGSYKITYEVRDSFGNLASAERTVVVKDMTPPEIWLLGDSEIYLENGMPYEEPGYIAKDVLDGNLTDSVVVSGVPNTERTGIYFVTYRVTDSSGNEKSARRTVYVAAAKNEDGTEVVLDKVVYLTFDDGPGQYTDELLAVLDKYNVKVTFFVTNQYPKYIDCIKKEFDAGHTVAIHTYTHDFDKVYASEDAYLDDLNKMSDICKEQTGVAPSIIRFPGGSSNAVSKKYCPGIMTKLTQTLPALGYDYCDWNVDSHDASNAKTADAVFNNVTKGIAANKVSIVLQHDIKQFSVQAVERIIKWGLENGYTFEPLTNASPMDHHKVNN